MLMIRLIRIGRKSQPFFRIGIMEKRAAAQGQPVEVVGWYNPLADKDKLNLKEDRIKYWMGKGAKPTNTVHNLLVDGGILKDRLKLHSTRHKKKKEKEKGPEKPPEKIEAPKPKEAAQAEGSLMEQGIEEAIKEEGKKEEVKEKIDEAKEEDLPAGSPREAGKAGKTEKKAEEKK
jgi:small subunit ribosomal protein S16